MKKLLLLLLLATAVSAFPQKSTQHDPVIRGFNNDLPQILSEQIFNDESRNVNDLIPVNDSIVSWQWNTDTEDWMLLSRTIDIMYDENYNVIASTTQAWSGTSWENQVQQTITFPDDVTVVLIMKIWDGSAWVNFWMYTTVMDPSANTTTITLQMWTGTAWMNQQQSVLVYDDNDNLISETTQSWAGTDWMNVWRYTYEYYPNGNLMSTLQQQWVSNAWLNHTLNTLSYSPDNNLTGDRMQMWQSNEWMNFSLDTLFTYDENNNNTGFTSMSWSDQWMNSTRTSYTFNSMNDMTSSIIETWMGSDWTLTAHSVFAYSYDDNGFTQGQSQKDLDPVTGAVVSGDSTHYYFHTVVSAGNIAVNGVLTVYPNPTRGSITIDVAGITGSIRSVVLYSLDGRLAETYNNYDASTQRMIITGIREGMYLLKVETGSGYYTTKLIVR